MLLRRPPTKTQRHTKPPRTQPQAPHNPPPDHQPAGARPRKCLQVCAEALCRGLTVLEDLLPLKGQCADLAQAGWGGGHVGERVGGSICLFYLFICLFIYLFVLSIDALLPSFIHAFVDFPAHVHVFRCLRDFRHMQTWNFNLHAPIHLSAYARYACITGTLEFRV